MNRFKFFANFLEFRQNSRFCGASEAETIQAMPPNSLETSVAALSGNLKLYPWYTFCRNLLFWQAVWFLFFQNNLSATEAILLYAVFDVATTALEVPSGYMSDRLGRRPTLILSACSSLAGTVCLAVGDSFAMFAMGQVLLGAAASFASGTDSALLYETLDRAGRKDEVEVQEMRAWRFSFAALAVSAASGGGMALVWDRLPFVAGIVAGCALVVLTFAFRETQPARASGSAGELERLRGLVGTLNNPILRWLLVLSVAMYVLSHVPFVFGQPFILEALGKVGLGAEAPAVSGIVSASMMVISVAVSWGAVAVRRRIGLGNLLLLAFAMQIALVVGLGLTGSAWAIGLLLLRMVPDSLSSPFLIARIQPLLGNESRATFLSLRSLIGRLVFAVTLWGASVVASTESPMGFGEIRIVMVGYALVGAVVWAWLAWTARRLRIER